MRATSAVAIACGIVGASGVHSRVHAQTPAAAAAPSATYTVHGVVIDSAHAPLRDVTVRLLVARAQVHQAVTGADGRFTLSTTSAGPTVVSVERAGFVPREVAVRGEPTRPLDSVTVELRVGADTVVAAAAEPTEIPARLRGFYERRNNKRGRFIDQQEIDASLGKRLSEMVRDLPGVRLMPSPNSAVSAVRFRGCQPLVWIDGVRNIGDELDAAISIGDVAAMEVYVSPASVPAQFRDNRAPCGAVLVWTR